MFRVAIIGCGNIAMVHRKVLMALPDVKLVACCDIVRKKAQTFAEKSEMNIYESVEELLEKEKPDVVHICIPHPLHTPIAKLCIEAGAHVFTEKPPVVNEEQWETFYTLKNAGKYVGVCFQNRYNFSVQRMKELLSGEKLGKVMGSRAFLTWNRTAQYYADGDWRGNWRTEGGGVLINQAIHTLDLLVYLFGAVERVDCHMSNHSLQDIIEVEDTTEAYITFKSGVNACFYATNAYCINAPVFIEVAAENGILRMEGDNLTIQWKNGFVEHLDNETQPEFEKDYWGNSHYTCIKDFYDAVSENRSFSNDIDSVEETMKLMMEMYKPFTGKKISVS